MRLSRALLLCLIAVFTTAIWGAILYVGSRLLGFPIGAVWLVAVLALIFLVLLLALSMGTLAARGDGPSPPGA